MNPLTLYAWCLISYFLFMIGIGIYHSTKIKSVDDYLIAGWNVGFWRIVGTTIATWCGASAFIGFMSMGYTSGISGVFFWVLPGTGFSIAFVLIFARILRRLKLYTIPDAFSLRFGKNAAFIPSLLQIFVYSIPTLALQFLGMGTIFKTFFGISLPIGILIGFALIFVYTVLGGLPSAILTDSIQSVILYLGVVLMLIIGTRYAGGINQVIELTPLDYWKPFGTEGVMKFVSLALTVGPFYMIWQCTWQRIYAAEDENTAVSGLTVGFILAGLATVISYVIGIIAKIYLPEGVPPDMVFATSIKAVFPPLVGAVVLTGLAAALMSSADSFIMMGSASIARDIYQQYFKPKATKQNMLAVSRWSVVFISLLALVIALFAKGIIPVYILVVKICGAGLLFPFFAMMFWRRATRAGVLTSMVVGVVVTIVWNIAGNPWVIEAVPGYLTSLISLILVSLLTDHAPDEQVKAAYWEPLDTTDYTSRLKHETESTASIFAGSANVSA